MSRSPDLDALTELAMDLHWTWNHSADDLWRRLDPEVWARTRHPSVVLQTVSPENLAKALGDSSFCATLHQLTQARREATARPTWFQSRYPQAALGRVAYFCMEFMLSEALPIYSGGLGNVAGDQLKAASDLGVPVVGIGLLYRHGYFRQVLDQEGNQQALYPSNDTAQLPVTPVLQADGHPLRIEVSLPGESVWLRAWQVQVGRLRLYLLDSNDAVNAPVHRGITSELYGGDVELRLKQEMVLGLGGWRLLTALGVPPDVCHLNEGHAAFVLLERARSFRQVTGQNFAVALAATRAGNLFTSHTAVPAGFDLFPPALMAQYFTAYSEGELGIPLADLMALGRQNPANAQEPFNMAFLALRGCGAANGVSELHGRVSRHIFAPLFSRWPEDEVPIGHVTNGVHMPTWDSAAADELWTAACGKERWRMVGPSLEADLRRVSDEKIWELRTASRRTLIASVQEIVGRQLIAAGAADETIARIKGRMNPAALMLGFARRFATYKRPNLLLHDPARLLRILKNRERPVQLILAGKAHPADQAGQALIKEWVHFIRDPATNPPVIFLADYDMLLAERLVQGVDVWINNPRRPWEACGTSGMKVLVNGGLNLSELDGWWAEAYRPDVGWALGDRGEHGEDPAWDAAEAEALYERLEQSVIPEFYSRNGQGIPAAWVARIRESMARLTPRFSAARAVGEYVEQYYIAAAEAYRHRSAERGAAARERIELGSTQARRWTNLRFGRVTVSTVGATHEIGVELMLGDFCPSDVRVEIYCGALNGEKALLQPMDCFAELPDASGGFAYRTAVPSNRPASDYTARISLVHQSTDLPLEKGCILWQK